MQRNAHVQRSKLEAHWLRAPKERKEARIVAVVVALSGQRRQTSLRVPSAALARCCCCSPRGRRTEASLGVQRATSSDAEKEKTPLSLSLSLFLLSEKTKKKWSSRQKLLVRVGSRFCCSENQQKNKDRFFIFCLVPFHSTQCSRTARRAARPVAPAGEML